MRFGVITVFTIGEGCCNGRPKASLPPSGSAFGGEARKETN
jgi:hypothetical protein